MTVSALQPPTYRGLLNGTLYVATCPIQTQNKRGAATVAAVSYLARLALQLVVQTRSSEHHCGLGWARVSFLISILSYWMDIQHL